MDAYRILFELTVDTADLDLDQVGQELFGITGEDFEKTYGIAAQRNFPFPGRVKQIAERFGAIKRGMFISHPNLCSLPTRFESTPIFEEALQETGRDLLDMERAKGVLSRVSSGAIAVQVFRSAETPTPMAYHILYRYLDVPELVAPDSLAKSTVQRMKMSIYGTSVQLVCLKCGNPERPGMIGDMKEEPTCSSCGAGLLSPAFWNAPRLAELIRKKRAHLEMSEDEGRELAKARRSADLVLSYGRRAIVAQAVYGIGPQTASRILARMIEDEDEFYKSLLEAKLQFITTRPFW
jgi:ATP-dependent Lhr-like helicase